MSPSRFANTNESNSKSCVCLRATAGHWARKAQVSWRTNNGRRCKERPLRPEMRAAYALRPTEPPPPAEWKAIAPTGQPRVLVVVALVALVAFPEVRVRLKLAGKTGSLRSERAGRPIKRTWAP